MMGLMLCSGVMFAANSSSSSFLPCDAPREIVLIPWGLPSSTTASPIALSRFLKSNPKKIFSDRFEALYTGAGMGKEGWDLYKAGGKKVVGQLLRKSNQAYDNGLDSSFTVTLPSQATLECRWFAGQIASLVMNNRSIYLIAQNPNGDVREVKSWNDIKLSYRSFDYKVAPSTRASTSISEGRHVRLKDGSDQFSFAKNNYEYRVTISKSGSSSVAVLLAGKLLSTSNALAQSFSLPPKLQ